jgi:hypothetical protein
MKRLAAAVLAIVATGCERPESDRVALTVQDAPENSHGWLVQAVELAQVRKAVIAQHTLYPYQFVANSAELNELGQRDLGILAEHYSVYPGPLNVRRGNESDDLYDQRVNTVVQALHRAGVDTSRIRVENAMSGGEGSPADRVVLVMLRSQQDSARRNASNGVGMVGLTGGSQ